MANKYKYDNNLFPISIPISQNKNKYKYKMFTCVINK